MGIFELIKKYISGILKRKELEELKENVSSLSNEELDGMFEDIWQEYVPPVMDKNIKQHINKELNSCISSKQMKRYPWHTIAAAVLIPLLFISTVYLYLNRPELPLQEFRVHSEKGQKSVVYLPDGTKVWLNSDSYINYSTAYNLNARNIELTGEAYFEVEKNPEKQFRVSTGGISVVVQGTAFNVSAYDKSQFITVSLNEGKVDVEKNSDHSLLASLLPNQQLVIDRKDLSFDLKPCDAGLFSLWTQNKLRFEDASPEEVFNQMEHWYGVNINLLNADPATKYVLTIKTESLREMLDLINRLTPITYTITGEEVTIQYK